LRDVAGALTALREFNFPNFNVSPEADTHADICTLPSIAPSFDRMGAPTGLLEAIRVSQLGTYKSALIVGSMWPGLRKYL